MAYSFDPIFAADPNNPAMVAANAAITLFDPADVSQAPVTITDVTGAPLTNPVTVNKNGFGPAFQHATLDRLGWSGGGFTGYFTSFEGIKAAAVAAQSAAETAGNDAANSAALVGAPADTAVETLITGTGTATRAALNATIGDQTGVTTADAAHTTKLIPGAGKNGLFIRSEQNSYALKVDQYDTAGAHDAVNIAANFTGGHTPFSVNSGNTTLSTVKIVNTAIQTGGAVIVGVASAPTRTAQVIQADNAGQGASFLATQQPGATGIGFQIQYLDAGSGTTTYTSRALWIAGHHTGGSLAYIENDKIQTAGNLMQLVQSNASSTADCLVISPFGSGVGLRINASGASTLIAASNFSVDANGGVRSPSIVNNASFSNSRIQLTTTGTLVDRTVADNNPVMRVQNASATSTGDVAQFIGISGSVGSRINKNAYIITAKTTAPADADLSANDLAFWFDSTNGAAKLMVKAKQADGTVRTGTVALA